MIRPNGFPLSQWTIWILIIWSLRRTLHTISEHLSMLQREPTIYSMHRNIKKWMHACPIDDLPWKSESSLRTHLWKIPRMQGAIRQKYCCYIASIRTAHNPQGMCTRVERWHQNHLRTIFPRCRAALQEFCFIFEQNRLVIAEHWSHRSSTLMCTCVEWMRYTSIYVL